MGVDAALRMGTFRDKNPIISEANSEASASRFAWFFPPNFYSAPRNDLNHLQSTQVSPDPGIPIPPIRYVPVVTEQAKNIDLEPKPSKARKQKASTKSSNSYNMAPKLMKPKQPRKNSSDSKKAKGNPMVAEIREKKIPSTFMAGTNFDFSGVPSPVCSCTGVARVCYKCGVSGFQSACCTINISEYPLPMSTSRPGSRVSGRKMSNGAYRNLLMRLAAEGRDLSHPVDLKNHWARHGTNKFVTIK